MKRIYHTWDQWECYPAGMYETKMPGKTDEQCFEMYREFLGDLEAFEVALQSVTTEWVKSCEHYLTNVRMNRIAWLGQASACYTLGLPSRYRGGFMRLSEDQQSAANELALTYLNKWMAAHGHPTLTMEEAGSKTRMDLY